MKGPPTITSVAQGLGKLVHEVRQLRSEVARLNRDIHGFANEAVRPWWKPNVLPPEAGGSREAKSETDEPKSAIDLVRYEYAASPNLEIPTKTLLAIAKELDGALRDIRAARLDIKAIADDSDLREDFRAWQKEQR